MNAIKLTLFMCLLTAISRILLKRGLASSNAVTGMIFSIVIGGVILLLVTIASVEINATHLPGILFFAGIGCIAPPLVRYMTYLGVEKLGAARSDPIRSLTPFFAIFFAVLFLGEKIGFYVIAGTTMIFIGVYFLSRKMGVDTKANFSSKYDLLFPAFAALIAGGVANLRKHGTALLDSPLLAATSAAVSAIFVFLVFLLVTGKWREIKMDKGSFKYFFLAGLLTAATDVLDILILANGSVSLVVPLMASTPLFIVGLTYLFNQHVETITRDIVIGAATVCGGISLISLAAWGGL